MENVRIYFNDLSTAWSFDKHREVGASVTAALQEGVSTSDQWRKIEERREMISSHIISLALLM